MGRLEDVLLAPSRGFYDILQLGKLQTSGILVQGGGEGGKQGFEQRGEPVRAKVPQRRR